MKGKFITFEGGEGCGKTLQIKLLSDYLKNKKYDVIITREPGGVPTAETIRNIIQNPDLPDINPTTELLLYEAARSEFSQKLVIPALNKGKIVLSDRYFDSTKAYQGYGNKTDIKIIDFLNKLASNNLFPDLTYVIDTFAEKGLNKVTTDEFGRLDKIEQRGLEYHKRVNQGYREIAKQDPKRVKLIQFIDGKPEKMHEIIIKYVDDLLGISS